MGAWFVGAGQGGHHLHRGAGALFDLGAQQVAPVGGGVGVGLVPFDARRHQQDVADADPVIGAASQCGDIVDDQVVQTIDMAIDDRGAYQGGGDGFGHRHRHPARVRRVAALIGLKDDRAVLQHDHPGDIVQRQEVVEVVGRVVDLIGDHTCQIDRSLRQRLGAVACRDCPGREQAVDVAEGADGQVRRQVAVIDVLDGADAFVRMRIGLGVQGARQGQARAAQGQQDTHPIKRAVGHAVLHPFRPCDDYSSKRARGRPYQASRRATGPEQTPRTTFFLPGGRWLLPLSVQLASDGM